MDGNLIWIVFLVIIGVQMFFGAKRQKQHAQESKKMMDSLAPGANVITIGGLHGVVSEVHDKTVVIDCEGIYLTFERNAIARVFAPKVTQVEDLYPQEEPDAIVTDLTSDSDEQ